MDPPPAEPFEGHAKRWDSEASAAHFELRLSVLEIDFSQDWAYKISIGCAPK
jgi:hypothetical protein